MKKRKILFSLLYSFGQITTGLLLHPYQTMQSLVRKKVFIWMTLVPSVCISFITIFWKLAVVPSVQLVFSCSQSGWLVCSAIPFFSNVITFFCIYWQILLLYLLVRFTIVYRD